MREHELPAPDSELDAADLGTAFGLDYSMGQQEDAGDFGIEN